MVRENHDTCKQLARNRDKQSSKNEQEKGCSVILWSISNVMIAVPMYMYIIIGYFEVLQGLNWVGIVS